MTVCVVQGTPRGATWGADGTIVFATQRALTGLQRVAGGRGRAHRPHHTRSRAWGSIISWPRVPAWRQGGPLHDHVSAGGRDRRRADRGAGSEYRDVESAYSRRQPRALLADRPSGLRCRRARCAPWPSILERLEVVGTTTHGAEWRHDDAIAALLTSRWRPTAPLVYVPEAWPVAACTLSRWWIARDIPSPLPGSLRTRMATSGLSPDGTRVRFGDDRQDGSGV